MTLMLTPAAKKKLVSFMVRRSLSPNPESEESKGSEIEEEGEEISGGLYAAEKMMKAITSNDAKLFDSALGEWFDMRPAEGSESHEDLESEEDEG